MNCIFRFPSAIYLLERANGTKLSIDSFPLSLRIGVASRLLPIKSLLNSSRQPRLAQDYKFTVILMSDTMRLHAGSLIANLPTSTWHPILGMANGTTPFIRTLILMQN